MKKKWSKWLKPYVVAVLLVGLYALDIFVLDIYFARWFGVWGSFLGEALLALIAVGVLMVFRGKMRMIFPFHRPRLTEIGGTVVFWLGVYLSAIMVTMAVAYFFPEQVLGAGSGVSDMVVSIPALLALLIVAISPAICEEIAFRGALLSCFRGMKNRWAAILIVSAIFGAFHGSVWRMIPTMILGIAMGYLLFETDNMFYNMLFHLINNALPILLIAAMGEAFEISSSGSGLMTEAGETVIPLSAIGLYLFYGSAAPFLIYLGNYLLHRGKSGGGEGLFAGKKKKHLTVLVGLSMGFMALGMILIMTGLTELINLS